MLWGGGEQSSRKLSQEPFERFFEDVFRHHAGLQAPGEEGKQQQGVTRITTFKICHPSFSWKNGDLLGDCNARRMIKVAANKDIPSITRKQP